MVSSVSMGLTGRGYNVYRLGWASLEDEWAQLGHGELGWRMRGARLGRALRPWEPNLGSQAAKSTAQSRRLWFLPVSRENASVGLQISPSGLAGGQMWCFCIHVFVYCSVSTRLAPAP